MVSVICQNFRINDFKASIFFPPNILSSTKVEQLVFEPLFLWSVTESPLLNLVILFLFDVQNLSINRKTLLVALKSSANKYNVFRALFYNWMTWLRPWVSLSNYWSFNNSASENVVFIPVSESTSVWGEINLHIPITFDHSLPLFSSLIFNHVFLA